MPKKQESEMPEENEHTENLTIVVHEKPEEAENDEDDLELSHSDDSINKDNYEPEIVENYQEVKDLNGRRLLKIGALVFLLISIIVISVTVPLVLLAPTTLPITEISSTTASLLIETTTIAQTSNKTTTSQSKSSAAELTTTISNNSEKQTSTKPTPVISTSLNISTSSSITNSTVIPVQTSSAASTSTTSPKTALTTTSTTTSITTSTTTQTTTSIFTTTTTSTTTSTTTIRVIEDDKECLGIDELLQLGGICRLNIGYPIKPCNKYDKGCYHLDGTCVKSLYMDMSLCAELLNWEFCEEEQSEDPDYIYELCNPPEK